MRVLHAPFAVAAHAPTLARAERDLGVDVEFVELSGTGARRELQRWRLLRRALREFDVVHFNFGSTFLPRYWPSAHHGLRAPYGWYARVVELRDLGWLGRARKAVFVTFQGDDARTAQDVRAPWADGYYDPRDDARKRLWVRRIGAGANGIFVLNPDLVPLVPGAEFLPYASVGLDEYTPAAQPRNARPVVVHAPSDRRAKGTDDIAAAFAHVDDLDLRIVEHASRAEVKAALVSADVVVDQVRLGWYGGLAVEAMALGRPVIAYVDEHALSHVPAEMRADLPVVSARPESLVEAARDALARRDELAARGREFAERWHDPHRVAERTVAAYEHATARIGRR